MSDDKHLPPDPVSDDDLGPEPDWLSGAVDDEPVDTPPTAEPAAQDRPEAVVPPPPADAQPRMRAEDIKARPAEARRASALPKDTPVRVDRDPATEPIEANAVAVSSEPVRESRPRKDQPWLMAAVPMLFLLVGAIIAWFATNQSLNNVTTLAALNAEDAPLLPARWATLMWWVVLPLLAIFLVYGALPRGRDITRIMFTGPLVTLGLVSSMVWIFAQHWDWDIASIASAIVTSSAMLIAYLLVATSKRATHTWQRLLSVVPVSVAMAYSAWLLVISWQQYTTQPFGERGTSVLILFVMVIVAAIIAFFLRDGAFALVSTVWLLGVAQRQWGDDALISLGSIVAIVFTAILTVMGTYLSLDSHRPAFTASVPVKRGRISFRRDRSESQETGLPE